MARISFTENLRLAYRHARDVDEMGTEAELDALADRAARLEESGGERR